MPLVHFVLFQTKYIKENFLALHEDYLQKHQFTPSRVNDSSISHLIHTSISFPTLISFIPLFFYFIHLYFTIFCFISFPSASFRFISSSFSFICFISSSFRFISHHFASFRIISHHFASFRILVGPS